MRVQRSRSRGDDNRPDHPWERYMARPAIPARMAFQRLLFDTETHLADIRMFQQEGVGAGYLIDDARDPGGPPRRGEGSAAPRTREARPGLPRLPRSRAPRAHDPR